MNEANKEHQRINHTNANTVAIDKQIARELGRKSWKFWRTKIAAETGQTGKPNHPHKTSGRRAMRSLVESRERIQPMLFPHRLKAGFYSRAQLKFFRQFTSEDHDNSTRPNRAMLRKGALPRGMFRRSPREWGGITNRKCSDEIVWRVAARHKKLEEVLGEDITNMTLDGPPRNQFESEIANKLKNELGLGEDIDHGFYADK